MEEKLLIIDSIKSLEYITVFETESLINIYDVELKNYIKACREEDEGFVQEIINLGISKGYLDLPKSVDENEVNDFKQNIL